MIFRLGTIHLTLSGGYVFGPRYLCPCGIHYVLFYNFQDAPRTSLEQTTVTQHAIVLWEGVILIQGCVITHSMDVMLDGMGHRVQQVCKDLILGEMGHRVQQVCNDLILGEMGYRVQHVFN